MAIRERDEGRHLLVEDMSKNWHITIESA